MKRSILEFRLGANDDYIRTLQREGYSDSELEPFRHESQALRVQIALTPEMTWKQWAVYGVSFLLALAAAGVLMVHRA